MPPSSWGQPPRPQRRSNVGLIIAGVVILLVAVGAVAMFLGSESDDDPPPRQAERATSSRTDIPDGFEDFVSKDDAFRIAVPKTWKVVDPSSPGSQAAWKMMVEANPTLKAMGASDPDALARQGMRLLVAGPVDLAQNRAPTLNVVVRPAPGITQDEVERQIRSEASSLESMGITLGEIQPTEIRGRKALVAPVTIRMNLPDGSKAAIKGKQVYVVANDFIYILTLAGDHADLDRMLDTFEAE